MSGFRIVGIGNEFRGDDAVGILIARKLKTDFPNLEIEEFSGNELNLINHFSQTKSLILIDAIFSTDEVSGTVKKFVIDETTELNELRFFSSHTISLVDVINLAKNLEIFPDKLIILGVYSSNFQLGNSPTFNIEHTYLEIKKEILSLINSLNK